MMSILKCGFPVCELTYSLRFNFGRTSGQSVPKRRGNSTRVMNADSDAAATADNSDFDYLDSTGKEDYCNGRNGAHRLKLVQTFIPSLHLLRTPNLYWIQVWSFTWLNNTIDSFFFKVSQCILYFYHGGYNFMFHIDSVVLWRFFW